VAVSFAVVVASYNNAAYLRRNLDSILRQEGVDFRILYVDDASPDGTGALVERHLEERGAAGKASLTRNLERRGAVANIDRAVRSVRPEEVVVLVDGDDMLSHPRVLARLAEIYEDPDVWLTYGQFSWHPQGGTGFCAAIPDDVVSANAFRTYPFLSSHLRAFRAALYHRIDPADLQVNGEFYRTAGDVAQMFAMLEMAGGRSRFIPEILYLYNRENPINDDKVDRGAQHRTEIEIRHRARYGRLRSLEATDGPLDLHFISRGPASLFEAPGPSLDGDEQLRPFQQMRSVLNYLGYTLREARSPPDGRLGRGAVFFDLPESGIDPGRAGACDVFDLVLWSGPARRPEGFDRSAHAPFRRIYTWSEDLIDGERYRRLRIPALRPMIDDVVPFADRDLCTLIGSNRVSGHPDALYEERRRVVEHFAAHAADAFTLYGLGWDAERLSCYRGRVPRRLDALRRHRFALCYESVRARGYVTARIFDGFRAGCVPVYLGAPDVAEQIPPECFIAREAFDSDEALLAHLRDMSESRHAEYLLRIRAFLGSERAVPFTPAHFVRTFVEMAGGRAAPPRRAPAVAPSQAEALSGIAGARR